MEPAPSDQPEPADAEQQEPQTVRPWERVKPPPIKDRQTRETFRPRAPSPVEVIIALHDEELQEEPAPCDVDPPSTVTCF